MDAVNRRTGGLQCCERVGLGVELREPLTTSPELARVIAALRDRVPTLEDDRYMADDLRNAADLVADGVLAGAVSGGILPSLEA
ncbi:MAG: bifunctional imidazolonepropionase/histidine ammonia-lyase [Brucella intermedia]|nr:MAG: bifunctional imidazolonepropionase/histidine ammonia-lyase [Brucella intermedia]